MAAGVDVPPELLRHAHPPAQHVAILADPDDVVPRVLVVRLGGPREGVDGVDEGVLDRLEVRRQGFEEEGMHDQAVHDGLVVAGNFSPVVEREDAERPADVADEVSNGEPHLLELAGQRTKPRILPRIVGMIGRELLSFGHVGGEIERDPGAQHAPVLFVEEPLGPRLTARKADGDSPGPVQAVAAAPEQQLHDSVDLRHQVKIRIVERPDDLLGVGVHLDHVAVGASEPVAEIFHLQEHFRPGQHLSFVERLREEIVGARLDPPDPVLLRSQRGDQDDGNAPRGFVLLDLFTCLVPVHLRHHHVQQNAIDPLLPDLAERFLPVPGEEDVIPHRRQDGFEELQIHDFVVDAENPRGVAAHRRLAFPSG
ncbi:MAG: hypothetical protein HZB63_07530 [Deltaproteobacteria bacterium]|nr:hypothetical protein [Deltaproteobacteria bacterium]